MNIENISEQEVLLKKGYYKISFQEVFTQESFTVYLSEDTWETDLQNYAKETFCTFRDVKVTRLDYIIDHREIENTYVL